MIKINDTRLLRIFVVVSTICSLYVTWKTYSFFLSEKKDVIRAQKFQLVDNADTVRAALQINKYKAVELLMYDETGKDVLISIHASHNSSEILLTNNINPGIFSITVDIDGNTSFKMAPINGDALRIEN